MTEEEAAEEAECVWGEGGRGGASASTERWFSSLSAWISSLSDCISAAFCIFEAVQPILSVSCRRREASFGCERIPQPVTAGE